MDTCANCKQPIQPGQLFRFDLKQKITIHAKCPSDPQQGLLGDEGDDLPIDRTTEEYPD
jgi:hypothetical protein